MNSKKTCKPALQEQTTFEWEAQNFKGERIKGEMSALTPTQVCQRLKDDGLFPIDVNTKGTKTSGPHKGSGFLRKISTAILLLGIFAIAVIAIHLKVVNLRPIIPEQIPLPNSNLPIRQSKKTATAEIRNNILAFTEKHFETNEHAASSENTSPTKNLSDITIGTQQKEVQQILGDPDATVEKNSKECWIYGKARIRFTNNRVSEIIQ